MLHLIAQASTQAATQPVADGTTPWERVLVYLIGGAVAVALAWIHRQGKRMDKMEDRTFTTALATPPPAVVADPAPVVTRPTHSTETDQ